MITILSLVKGIAGYLAGIVYRAVAEECIGVILAAIVCPSSPPHFLAAVLYRDTLTARATGTTWYFTLIGLTGVNF